MTRRQIKKIVSLLGGILLILAIPVGLTWREVYRQQLNRDLIAAIKVNDADRVTEFLDRGADANTYDEPIQNISAWQIFLDRVRGRHKPPSNAPSALQLALDWRPDPHSSTVPTTEDTPLIQALMRHEARQGAREILARMARNCAFCSSYQDTGSVTSDLDVKTFHTAFVRPSRFYFEYTSGPTNMVKDRYAIWERDGKAYSWWSIQPGVQQGPLEMAIAGATGVSGGSAHTIPNLLMRDRVGGWALTELHDVKLLGTRNVDGTRCYEITGKANIPSLSIDLTIAIDAGSFLLRKIVEQTKFQGNNFEGATVYHPQINHPIVDSVFRFAPPK